MVPFLIDMSQPYEEIVATLLQRKEVDGYRVRAQHAVDWDRANARHSQVDLDPADADTRQVACVLDTKYKAPYKPANEDIHQVVFYAHLIGCHEAALVYPVPLANPTNTWVGDIHIRTLTFSLDGDLDEAGEQFLDALGVSVPGI